MPNGQAMTEPQIKSEAVEAAKKSYSPEAIARRLRMVMGVISLQCLGLGVDDAMLNALGAILSLPSNSDATAVAETIKQQAEQLSKFYLDRLEAIINKPEPGAEA